MRALGKAELVVALHACSADTLEFIQPLRERAEGAARPLSDAGRQRIQPALGARSAKSALSCARSAPIGSGPSCRSRPGNGSTPIPAPRCSPCRTRERGGVPPRQAGRGARDRYRRAQLPLSGVSRRRRAQPRLRPVRRARAGRPGCGSTSTPTTRLDRPVGRPFSTIAAARSAPRPAPGISSATTGPRWRSATSCAPGRGARRSAPTAGCMPLAGACPIGSKAWLKAVLARSPLRHEAFDRRRGDFRRDRRRVFLPAARVARPIRNASRRGISRRPATGTCQILMRGPVQRHPRSGPALHRARPRSRQRAEAHRAVPRSRPSGGGSPMRPTTRATMSYLPSSACEPARGRVGWLITQWASPRPLLGRRGRRVSSLRQVNILDTFDFRLVATVALAANNEGRASQNREEIQLATDRRGAQ